MKVTIAAPAKVNLRLRVGEPDGSGYHAIDTLFCALHLADSVVARPGEGAGPTLELAYAPPLQEMPDLGPERENLALVAARAFMERAGLERGPGIRLVKRIPAGAGLGGGSSDAAAVLRAMQRLHPGALDHDEVLAIARRLGSDVPFFVGGAPLAHGTGRGERLAARPPLPARAVVVAIPDFPVSTAEAYRWLDQDRVSAPAVAADPDGDARLDWAGVAAAAVNDFEGPVFRRHPELGALRDRIRDAGARPALLAGSGSTVFGVFESRDAARRCAASLQETDPSVRALVTRTRTR